MKLRKRHVFIFFKVAPFVIYVGNACFFVCTAEKDNIICYCRCEYAKVIGQVAAVDLNLCNELMSLSFHKEMKLFKFLKKVQKLDLCI